jgi:PAS domain S-box-containing protein
MGRRRERLNGGKEDRSPLEQAFNNFSLPGFIDQISNPVSITDLQGNIVFWNKESERTYLWSKEEVLGRNLFEVLSPAFAQIDTKGMVGTLGAAGSWHGRVNVLRKDGKALVISVTSAVLRDQAGQIIGLMGISSDVTQEAEEAALAREREEKYAQLFNTMAQGVVFRDERGKVLSMNPAAERILGRSASGLIGHALENEYHAAIREDGTPFSNEEHPSMVALRTGRVVNEVMMGLLNPRDRRYHWVTVNAVPLYRPGDKRPYQVYTIFTDLTEQRSERECSLKMIFESEGRMRQSLAEIETIYETAPIGLCFLDTDLRYVRINKRMAELNGVPVKDHIGRTVRDIVPSFNEQTESALRRVLDTGEPLLDVEFKGHSTSVPGTERTWIESWLPVRGIDDRIIGINVAAEEVTERKRVLNELEGTRARLEAVLNQMPIAVLIVEPPDGRTTFANQEVGLMPHTCFRTTSRMGEDAHWHAHWPDGRPLSEEEYPGARSLRGETVRNELLRARREDGEWIWIRISSAPVRDQEGRITASVVMAMDVTEQIVSQNRVLELMERSENERARLQIILATLPVGIFIVDAEGGVLMANSHAEMIWKVMPEDPTVSKQGPGLFPIWSLDGGDRIGREGHPIMRMLHRGKTIVGEQYCMRLSDGSLGRIMISGAPIRNCEGLIIGGVMVVQDVTDQRKTEEELAQRAEELARSNNELQQYAYIASHDLREPLRMISSYLGLLERKYKGRELDAKALEYIHYATEGSIRMQQMINDLLTFSRIETSAGVFDATDMNAVMKNVVRNLSVSIKESGATVAFGRLPTIWAYRPQMEQLMQNLIDNAIKYRGSDPPEVEVSATNRGGKWLFSVRDNGAGVSPHMAERIFQMFQRGYTQEERPGTGIGLAIAKKIVELHGGRIWVESVEGKGSTFRFLLPEKLEGTEALVQGPMNVFQGANNLE